MSPRFPFKYVNTSVIKNALCFYTHEQPASNQRATSPNPKLLKSRLGKILEIANTYLSKTFIEFKPLWP